LFTASIAPRDRFR